MADLDLTERLMAAYQYVTPALGNPVSLADIRLHLGDVEPHVLNPLLRALNGTVVPFWFPDNDRQQQGALSLLARPEASWPELDDGVEIDEVIYTHMWVQPCG